MPALAAACTTVGACSTNQGTGDNPATGVSASPTVDKGSVDPHTTVVDDTAAPQGYTMDSINQMIQDQEAESPGINQDMVSMAQEITADPAECAALIPTGVTYISKIVQNPDAIAARDFTNESTDATLSVAVSSDPQLSNHPRDVSVCESITRAHAGGSTSYTAAPMELRVDGADSVTAAEVTLTQSSSPPPLSGDNGSVSRIAYVEIDGATYTVSGSPKSHPKISPAWSRRRPRKSASDNTPRVMPAPLPGHRWRAGDVAYRQARLTGSHTPAAVAGSPPRMGSKRRPAIRNSSPDIPQVVAHPGKCPRLQRVLAFPCWQSLSQYGKSHTARKPLSSQHKENESRAASSLRLSARATRRSPLSQELLPH
ncbi:hypothetical protein [Corynebacterium propinquum]|uniref:hypothetical protein n=1 Tax=Corynebacterium propinquum TaxID=43769 RepID=UPI0016426A14|nr:hypothetical protein [Corynebacterium propinquum]